MEGVAEEEVLSGSECLGLQAQCSVLHLAESQVQPLTKKQSLTQNSHQPSQCSCVGRERGGSCLPLFPIDSADLVPTQIVGLDNSFPKLNQENYSRISQLPRFLQLQ